DQPHLARTETASSHYLASHYNEHNPQKDSCIQEVSSLTNLVSQMESRQQQNQDNYAACVAGANSQRNMGTKILGLTACSMQNTNIIGGNINDEQEKLNTARANCADIPD